MDAHDAEARIAGRAAIGRELGTRRKFLALLFTHTLLTGACIAFCVYTLQTLDQWGKQSLDKGIYLNMIPVVDSNNSMLKFRMTWNKDMELKNETEVTVQLAGPYIFYIYASMESVADGHGNLTLKQGKTKTSIKLQYAPDNSKVRYERLISLNEKDVVTFSLDKTLEPYFNVIQLRIGLHYMLGAQNFKTPTED